MRKLIRCRRGATAIEYGLFLGLAALVLSSGLSTIGDRVGGTFAKAAGAMAATPAPAASATPGTRATNAVGDARLIRIDETRDGFLERHRQDP